jgi:hypothetical protein
MSPAGESVAESRQESSHLIERLRVFMRAHHLSLEELAGLLHTQPQTLLDWFDGGETPPASLLALMILIDTLPHTRRRIGAPLIAAARRHSFEHSGRTMR